MRVSAQNLRDNTWLLSRLDTLWSKYFEDVTAENPIFVRFGRHSKYRLGSIRLDSRTGKSYITITAMFKSPKVPENVVDHTLAHELIHYAHGFSSKRIRLHKYPHAGGVVQNEMKKRGMRYLIQGYKSWVKGYRKRLLAHG